VLAPLEDDRLEPQRVIRDGQRAQHGVRGLGIAATIALATVRGAVWRVLSQISILGAKSGKWVSAIQ
jgi:hypothetical protein